MTPISRTFSYLRYHIKEIVLNILFNLLSVVFNLFSFVLIVPVIELFFGLSTPPASLPDFAFNREALTEWALYHLYTYKEQAGMWTSLLTFAGAYIVCVLLYDLCRYMGSYFLSPIRNGVLRRMRDDLYHKITILPISYFSQRSKGDLISRLSSDLADIEWSVVSTLQSLVKDPINIILFAGTLLFISPRLFLILLVVLPPAVWVISLIGRSLKRNSAKGQRRLGDLLASYKESLDNLEVIKAFRRQDYRQDQFDTVNADYTRRAFRIAARNEAGSPLSEFLGTIALAFILVLGGNAVLGGDLQPSVFILFVIVFARLIPPVQAIVKAYSSLQKGSAAAKRIFDILDADERIVELPDAIVLNKFDDAISYNNITFAYDSPEGVKTDVLKDVSLTIRRGQKVAVVGPSGSGKTTLVDLLPRFYDPTSGNVTIDGVDLRQFNIDSLRGNIGVVSQNCILFNDTIANNIAFGMPGVTSEQIRHAAHLAGAHEFIMQMPQGYDTPVGDHGSALSGGQRQRVSIARAILRNPPILILDEATSALDTATQQSVQQSIDTLMEGRTTIVIAHRLSTIRNADLIVVLDHGGIIEQGTHDTLMREGGVYAGMVALQDESM